MDSTNPIGYMEVFCAKKHIAFPKYVERDTTGADHCHVFSCSCTFLEKTVEAKGSTRNMAKREAASAMLKLLTLDGFFSKQQIRDNVRSVNSVSSTLSGKKNPISVLQENFHKPGETLPSYSEKSAPNGGFLCECTVKGKHTVGRGETKKVAKTDSAIKMLQELGIDYENLAGLPEDPHDDSSISGRNPISILMELCTQNKLPWPEFETDSTLAGVFTVKVTVGELEAKGVWTNKQGAKTFACSKILVNLRAQGHAESIQPIKKSNLSSQCENVNVPGQNLDNLLPDFDPNTISSSVETLSLDDSSWGIYTRQMTIFYNNNTYWISICLLK